MKYDLGLNELPYEVVAQQQLYTAWSVSSAAFYFIIQLFSLFGIYQTIDEPFLWLVHLAMYI